MRSLEYLEYKRHSRFKRGECSFQEALDGQVSRRSLEAKGDMKQTPKLSMTITMSENHTEEASLT